LPERALETLTSKSAVALRWIRRGQSPYAVSGLAPFGPASIEVFGGAPAQVRILLPLLDIALSLFDHRLRRMRLPPR
jgi:hypothetical protein